LLLERKNPRVGLKESATAVCKRKITGLVPVKIVAVAQREREFQQQAESSQSLEMAVGCLQGRNMRFLIAVLPDKRWKASLVR
jgi:hypothetical protein